MKYGIDKAKALYGEDFLQKIGIDTESEALMAGAEGNGFTPYQTFTATQALKKNTQTMNAASIELKRQTGIINDTWNRLESGEAKDLNATSQAIIVTFNKILDPNSVVRESEYDRTSAGQALLSSIYGKMAAIQQGGPGLTRQSLKELVDLGNVYARNAQASIDMKNEAAREEARFFGLNPDFVTSSSYTETESGDPNDPVYQEYQEYLKATGQTRFNTEGSVSKNAMRTDRHNNPTAFTTDIAKLAGLKEGVDYAVGDPFSGGKYYTATLLGDPIDTTIQVIDKIGFQTSSGKPRWDYINIPKSQWDNMSYEQKKQTIATMYKREGGTQLNQYFA